MLAYIPLVELRQLVFEWTGDVYSWHRLTRTGTAESRLLLVASNPAKCLSNENPCSINIILSK